MSKIRGGINTTGTNWRRVFNEKTRLKLAEIADFNDRSLSESEDPASRADCLVGAEVVFSTWGAVPLSAELLQVCPDLKLIIHAAGSVKCFVTPELQVRRVRICSASHVNAEPVARYTLGLILCSLKGGPVWQRKLGRKGRKAWNPEVFATQDGYVEKKIGLVGLGEISRRLIELLKPFGFEVLVCSEHLSTEEQRTLSVKKATLEQIMSQCDIVSLHAADTPVNRHLINGEKLRMMKDKSILINTSRGQLINEEDLVRSLKEQLISVFLDVSWPEPPEAGHPFYTLDNCFLTPHIAGSVGREIEQMGEYCHRELSNWLAGRPLEHEIDIDLLNRLA